MAQRPASSRQEEDGQHTHHRHGTPHKGRADIWSQGYEQDALADLQVLSRAKTGRKTGSYVPISIGQMRNSWFPRRTAEYVTDSQLKELKAKNISAERDFQFGVPDPAMAKAATPQSQRLPTRTVEVEKLTVTFVFCLRRISSMLTGPLGPTLN